MIHGYTPAAKAAGAFLYQNQLGKDVWIDIFNSFNYYKLDYVNK